MFFVGKTGTHSKDVLYEDLENRIKRVEQRLARLEQTDHKSSIHEEKGKELNASLNERVEKLERAISRPESIVGPAPIKPSPLEKQPRSDHQAKPQPLEKGKRAGFHQVVEGDTLFKISRLYGVSVDDLRRWNNMPAGDGIRTGQKLRVSEPNG
jgi:membrane-bound lytic murein transglycosylase D